MLISVDRMAQTSRIYTALIDEILWSAVTCDWNHVEQLLLSESLATSLDRLHQ